MTSEIVENLGFVKKPKTARIELYEPIWDHDRHVGDPVKTLLMQRLLDLVHHGYRHYTAGVIGATRARCARNFSAATRWA